MSSAGLAQNRRRSATTRARIFAADFLQMQQTPSGRLNEKLYPLQSRYLIFVWPYGIN
jgi:hypothetical protein